ncbi:MAG: hypothetical protein HRT44_11880, partial [Bdellovibrionales bacterium]|nr:hypothetical protein [Bdellovibrionales bacterium]
MYENLTKEELAEKMREKIQAELADDGAAQLVIHNLENFAYRYMETSTYSDIKCSFDKNLFWVESIEVDILEALKWKNKEVKSGLISVCKEYPGAKSKEIKVQLKLVTHLDSNKAKCQAVVNWDFPEFKSMEKQILKESSHNFEDFFELRNNHASWLEELTNIF